MADWRSEIRKRVAGAGLEPTREAEIVEELAQHLEERHAELRARGMEGGAADAAVLAELDAGDTLGRRLGPVTPRAQHPPQPGETRGDRLADLASDARYAVRSLLRKPGFAAVTLLTLALGIGANSAIFQMIDTLHLQLLPIERPAELGLVQIANSRWRMGRTSGSRGDYSLLTHRMVEAIRERQQGFTDVIAFADGQVNLEPQGVARWARALYMSGDTLQLLGVRPILGRSFTAADDVRGCSDPGVVVSHGFWQRELGGDPGAIGRQLSVERHSLTVVGVTPASFFGLEIGRAFDVALPLCLEKVFYGEEAMTDLPYGYWLTAVGRVKPGWTLERAGAQLEAASKGIFADTVPPRYDAAAAEKYQAYRLGVTPAAAGVSEVRDRYSRPLAFLFGIAALLLLIACANLANLFLARASARERELSIRLAIGASRGRLIRQLMAESLLVALVGAALGLVVARLLAGLLVGLLSTPGAELFLDLAPSWRLLAFTAGLTTLTCLLFGLAPALRASRADVGQVLKATGSAATDGRGRFGLRRVLVAVQVALSFVLLFGALLFVRSLNNLVTLDPGFRTDVVTVSVDASALDLPRERRVRFFAELLERTRAAPGVDAAAAARIVPLSGSGWNDRVWLDGAGREQARAVMFHRVSAGYFATLGAPLLAGRDFGPGDTTGSPKVAVVTARFAQQLAPGADGIVGRRFHVAAGPGGGSDQTFEIIGVVADMKYRTLREETQPTVFVPQSQDDDPEPYINLLVRGAATPAGVMGPLKKTIADHDPRLVIELDVISQLVARSVLVERLMATLAAFFGFLAALLAVVGLYGVVAYSVARRVHEIGIRMALGADPERVARMILREAAGLLVTGLLVGVGLALLASRAARALLFGLAPHDPTTVLVAVALMAAVTFLASLVPARRAARTDPMVALRDE